MSDERYLVTGALGCVGAWVVRTLVEEDASVVALDLAEHAPRLDLVLSPEQRAAATFVVGDIGDLAGLERVLDEHDVTRVIHLAALQVPFCRDDPALGARVNVVGTVNVFEAVKRRRERIPGVVYASSAAVFGLEDAVGGAAVPADAPAHPATHYGVYKQANEGSARVYWTDDGVASVGLRPYVVYGVGRDQGLTSSPTKAMVAAALGQPYTIGYGGRSHLQFAPDVARSFVAAGEALAAGGARVVNLAGSLVHMREVVAAIEAAAPEAAGRIGFDDVPLPFPEELDASGLEETLGVLEETPLAEGVERTIEAFRALARDGRL